jgi:hypothetical protein
MVCQRSVRRGRTAPCLLSPLEECNAGDSKRRSEGPDLARENAAGRPAVSDTSSCWCEENRHGDNTWTAGNDAVIEGAAGERVTDEAQQQAEEQEC